MSFTTPLLPPASAGRGGYRLAMVCPGCRVLSRRLSTTSS